MGLAPITHAQMQRDFIIGVDGERARGRNFLVNHTLKARACLNDLMVKLLFAPGLVDLMDVSVH